ncbi:MAG: Rieske (2Fe-2S) protein [Nitrospirae bacterium]|nr:Rieske (2Fe-2S) protein [Nitrospirota bacterium]
MIKIFFTGVAVVSGLIALIFAYPARIRKRKTLFIPVLDELDIPRRGVKTVNFSYKRGEQLISTRAFIVQHKGRLFALSPVCSHLGCLVNWHRKKGQFLCPCHGGKYDIEGNVIAGPPPRPLTRLPMKLDKGKLYLGIKV